MTPLVWPGIGVDADLLVFQHVLGGDVSRVLSKDEAGAFVKPGTFPGGRSLVPPYTRTHAVAVSHIVEPMEEDGFFFTVGNETGRYVAKLKKGGKEWQGQSRHSAAESICLAALASKGFQVVFR